MSDCYVCEKTATARVTLIKKDGSSGGSYLACDDHEPKHIPQGEIVAIDIKPV